jgi:hypothetical protein
VVIDIGSPDAPVTLTAEQAACDFIEITGVPADTITLTVPPYPQQWTVYNNMSGSPQVFLYVVNSGSPQHGIMIDGGKCAIVRSDYDRVYRVTPDIDPTV